MKRSRTPPPTRPHRPHKCIIINPFHGGSHKQFVKNLISHFATLHQSNSTRNTAIKSHAIYHLPGKKWHWRLLVSAAHFAHIIPPDTLGKDGILFTTSLLNLATLIALRPDLGQRTKILYFHENQFEYPDSIGNQHQNQSQNQSQKQTSSKKWSEYGWAQMMSCLAADYIYFNSKHNMETFIQGAKRLLSEIPSPSRPENIVEQIQMKSKVLYYPVQMSFLTHTTELQMQQEQQQHHQHQRQQQHLPLHIVWNHRWEFDKGPNELYELIKRWSTNGKYQLRISIVGIEYPNIPQSLHAIRNEFVDAEGSSTNNLIEFVHFGPIKEYQEYVLLLQNADIVLSTANHEFFGVAVMEGVAAGCCPVCPNKLSYPELYPKDCLYNTNNQMFKMLKSHASNPFKFRTVTRPKLLQLINVQQYSLKTLGDTYEKIMFGSDGNKVLQKKANEKLGYLFVLVLLFSLIVVMLNDWWGIFLKQER